MRVCENRNTPYSHSKFCLWEYEYAFCYDDNSIIAFREEIISPLKRHFPSGPVRAASLSKQTVYLRCHSLKALHLSTEKQTKKAIIGSPLLRHTNTLSHVQERMGENQGPSFARKHNFNLFVTNFVSL